MNQNRILIVEDEFIVARNLQRRLMSLGFSVVPAIAATAEQAVQEAERSHPDLVLMDIRLEGEGDGIAAAREIHERLDIPVIYLTAYADADTIRRAKVTEPLGFLPKPFGLRELQSTIEVALYKHGVDRRVRQSERWLSAILRSIGDAVIATDEYGVVTLMNRAAEDLTGRPQQCAVGGPLTELLSVTALPPIEGLPDPAGAALRDGRLVDLSRDLLVRSADGSETPVACTATPLVDERGRTVGAVLVLHALTERPRAGEALQGPLPICVSCHRMRDPHGTWQELDDYLKQSAGTEEGSVLCPRCASRLATPPSDD